MKVISANIDDMRNDTIINELDIRMSQIKADIICIQETHNTKTEDHKTENYRYISTAAEKVTGKENEKGNGGISIMIKNEWAENIEKITRYTTRCMKITLTTGLRKRKCT